MLRVAWSLGQPEQDGNAWQLVFSDVRYETCFILELKSEPEPEPELGPSLSEMEVLSGLKWMRHISLWNRSVSLPAEPEPELEPAEPERGGNAWCSQMDETFHSAIEARDSSAGSTHHAAKPDC